MKKVYFILNLRAGKAMISEKLADIINNLTKAGYEVTVHPTQSSEDAFESAKDLYDKYDMLLCAGGDGTLSQCIQGIMASEKRLPIGYIPAGSTNDFAKSLGISSNPIEAVNSVINGRKMGCDIGSFNGQYFTYIVAFGAFTNVTYQTSQTIKNVLGHTAYLLSGISQLKTVRSKRMRVEYDGNVIEGDFIFGMVTNSSSIAGLLSMDDFLLDDGVFEVTLIEKPANIVQLPKIVRSLLNINEEINKKYIKFFRTKKIKFISLGDEPVSWTRDGEFGGDNKVNEIECCTKALQFMVEDKKENHFAEDSIEFSDD